MTSKIPTFAEAPLDKEVRYTPNKKEMDLGHTIERHVNALASAGEIPKFKYVPKRLPTKSIMHSLRKKGATYGFLADQLLECVTAEVVRVDHRQKHIKVTDLALRLRAVEFILKLQEKEREEIARIERENRLGEEKVRLANLPPPPVQVVVREVVKEVEVKVKEPEKKPEPKKEPETIERHEDIDLFPEVET